MEAGYFSQVIYLKRGIRKRGQLSSLFYLESNMLLVTQKVGTVPIATCLTHEMAYEITSASYRYAR